MTNRILDGRKNNLDFIRLTLAVLVLYSHCYFLVDGSPDPLLRATRQIWFGGLAVNWFFAISGFLIVASWMKSRNALDYFRRRIARIYPAYFIVALVCIFVIGPLGDSSSVTFFSKCKWGRLLVSTITLGHASMPDSFPTLASHRINSSLWTIRYEFVCYVGVAVLGLMGLFRSRIPVAGLALLLLIIELLLGVLHLQFAPNATCFAMSISDMLRFAMYFSIGACVFLYREFIALSGWLFVAAVVLLVTSSVTHKAMYLLLPTFGTYVLFYTAFNPQWNFRAISRLGDFSYGTYLWAWPIEQLCLRYVPWTATPWRLFVMAFPITLLVAGASWFLIERPMLRWGHTRRPAVCAAKSPEPVLNS